MTDPDTRTPAQVAMDEAIELDIAGRNPYPSRASFVDADAPWLGEEIARASDEGHALVICYADGTRRVISPATRVAAS